ncbi:MAG TPA: branched-chain amino acid ABC transporter permease [Stellaceae bacterium]
MSITSPIPAYRIQRSTRTGWIGLALAVIIVAVLVSLPWWGGEDDLRLIVEICYTIALAQMWNLLAGYAGLVSVGQQAFVGIGGYALFALTIIAHVPPIPAVVLAGVAAAILAVPSAWVVFRLRGAYFAIGTWVVAEVFRGLMGLIPELGSGTGMSLPVAISRAVGATRFERETALYYVGLAIGVGTVAAVFAWLRSRQGLALTAIRDSETAAGSVGINNDRTKFAVYILAALATGMVGALIYLEKLRISPDAAFDVIDWTADVIFIVVIGGIGSIEGPFIGALVFFGLRYFLADYGAWYMILLGAVAVIIMLLAPRGLWGLLADRFDIHFFPVRRRVRLE